MLTVFEFAPETSDLSLSIGLLTFGHLDSFTACSTGNPGSQSLIEDSEFLGEFASWPGELQHLTDSLSTKLPRTLGTSSHVLIACLARSGQHAAWSFTALVERMTCVERQNAFSTKATIARLAATVPGRLNEIRQQRPYLWPTLRNWMA